MAMPKTLPWLMVLLPLCSGALHYNGHTHSASVYFEEVGTEPRRVHSRAKREAQTDYLIEVEIELDDIEKLRTNLNSIEIPADINGTTTTINRLNITTVCSAEKCTCDPGFVLPDDTCRVKGHCTDTPTGPCSCIIGRLEDGKQCQELFDFDIEVELLLGSRNPSDILSMVREKLRNAPLPFAVNSNSVTLIQNATLTTTCLPMEPGKFRCECEDNFSFPCQQCNASKTCSNSSASVCNCLDGLPSAGAFCEPNLPACFTTTAPTTTLPSTTQATTTTTENPTTTTTTAPVTQEPQVRTLRLIINEPFEQSFNTPGSKVYQDTQRAIQKQCENSTAIPKCRSNIIGLRSGSTIADYTISAPTISNDDVRTFNIEVFKSLGETLPVIFESPKTFDIKSTRPYFGGGMNMTCGPPLSDLNLGEVLFVQWSRNGKNLSLDSEHRSVLEGGQANLTVTKLSFDDQGSYVCQLWRTPSAQFRQKSSGAFRATDPPVINTTPRRTAKCEDGGTEWVNCSVQSPYHVQLIKLPSKDKVLASQDIRYNLTMEGDCQPNTREFRCEVVEDTQIRVNIVLQFTTADSFTCLRDSVFGDGFLNEVRVILCEPDEVGSKTARCQADGQWVDRSDTCILRVVQQLLTDSEDLEPEDFTEFVSTLEEQINKDNITERVVSSPQNINAIVDVLNNVANVTSNITVSQSSMEDILLTVGILTLDAASESWETLNSQDVEDNSGSGPSNGSASSTLLLAMETITKRLVNDSFVIQTDSISLNKTTFTDSFSGDINGTVDIQISVPDSADRTLTTLNFASLDNVLPPRDQRNSSFNVINGRVLLVQSSGAIDNASFTFQIINDTLFSPQCVFWNFRLFDGLGGWDDQGCRLLLSDNQSVTCNCDHLTSFSILMSTSAPNSQALSLITYIGVGISIASLLICLIIEAVVWRKIRRNTTSYLRHVSIVNIAVSLLIADIWFIIGAVVADKEPFNGQACTAATFFIHLFYLALFFWMLASALLLLYRTLSVFDGGLSKRAMLAAGFCLGYGAPLIIAGITIAVTEPTGGYASHGDNESQRVCWLSAAPSFSMLAFVVPALLILLINFIILVVVLYKMLRRRGRANASQAGERSALMVIARSLAVLTPIFGLTWALGIGTLDDPDNLGIHGAFAFFNSLQGFFILVFGTLLDKKVRTEIANISQSSGAGTRSTSAGNSSSGGGLQFFKNWRRGRDGYNVSSNTSEGANQSFTNT